MVFRRARRRPGNVSTSPKRPKGKPKIQDRSVSSSTCLSTTTDNPVLNDENFVHEKPKHCWMFTFDKLLTGNEAQEEPALVARQDSPLVSAVHSDALPGQLQGTKKRDTSVQFCGTQSNIADELPPASAENFQTSTEPFPSVTSSRRTSIFLGHPDHIDISGIKTHDFGTANTDDLRKQTEEDYYSTTDTEGTVRRRSLMRNVSRDDYLMARGANPRTGIVTPGIHSASSSYDEVEILRTRGIAPPGKWRQRGDQWISFDQGQPTPPFSPVHAPTMPETGRQLRIPPKLTATKYNSAGASRDSTKNSLSDVQHRQRLVGPGPMDGWDQHQQDAHILPGKYPLSPRKEDLNLSPGVDPGPGLTIKRKPVGTTPSTGKSGLRRRIPDESTETVIMKHQFAVHDRSSLVPAPMLHNHPFFSPSDVSNAAGKDLPSLPSGSKFLQFEEDLIRKMPNQSSFLGPKPLNWVEGVQEYQTTCGLGKILPCLPTSSGRSRFLPSVEVAQNMPMADRLTQDAHAGRKIQKSLMPVPTYDNPPSQALFPPRSMRGKIVGPREMKQTRSTSETNRSANDIFTTPTTITSTNTRTRTRTHIPTFTQQSRRPQIPAQMMMGYRPVQDFDHLLQQEHPQPQRRGNMSMSSNGPTAGPQYRPRGPTRPHMHDRTNAMHNVHSVSPHLNDLGNSMGDRHQWRMTGMRERGRQERQDTSGTASFEIDRGLVPTPLKQVLSYQLDGDKTRPPSAQDKIIAREQTHAGIEIQLSQTNGLTKRCNRYHNGYVEEQPRSTDGHIHTSEILPEEGEGKRGSSGLDSDDTTLVSDASSMVNTSAGLQKNGERDHLTCCPECCVTAQCHESCLGHPTPSTHSPSQIAKGSPPCALPSSSQHGVKKAAFIKDGGRGASPTRMRKTLRLRKSPETKVKTRWGRPESPIELDSHPLSPGPFWGGQGTGAIYAAKRALGFGGNTSTAAKFVPGRASNQAKRILTEPGRSKQEEPTQADPQQRTASMGTVRRHQSSSEDSICTIITAASRNRSRHASGASMISMRSINVPGIGSMDLGGILEMLIVPLEALGMWISQHPEVQGLGWSIVSRAGEMGHCMARTTGRLWEMAYVYSKTGKIKVNGGNMGGLTLDCGRSAVYFCIFCGVAVLCGRILGAMLGLLRGVYWVYSLLGWVLKGLGLGVLW